LAIFFASAIKTTFQTHSKPNHPCGPHKFDCLHFKNAFVNLSRYNQETRENHFIDNNKVVEVQLSLDQTTNKVNGFRSVFLNEDTSVVEGYEITSQKPVNISLESYKESFSHIFGDAELV